MDAGTNFGLIVVQTEVERFKFLVRSFLRARIAKVRYAFIIFSNDMVALAERDQIDEHPHHILSLHNSNPLSQTQSQIPLPLDPSIPLLSSHEASYAQVHTALLERHYHSSFLSSFPQKLQRFDDRAGVSMIEGPDLDKAVFVRCLGVKKQGRNFEAFETQEEEKGNGDAEETFGAMDASCGFTDVSDSNEDAGQMEGFRGERMIHMRRGDIWVVRWRSVREAIARRECELL